MTVCCPESSEACEIRSDSRPLSTPARPGCDGLARVPPQSNDRPLRDIECAIGRPRQILRCGENHRQVLAHMDGLMHRGRVTAFNSLSGL